MVVKYEERNYYLRHVRRLVDIFMTFIYNSSALTQIRSSNIFEAFHFESRELEGTQNFGRMDR